MGSEDPSSSPGPEHKGSEFGKRDLFTSTKGKKLQVNYFNIGFYFISGLTFFLKDATCFYMSSDGL